MQNSDRDAEFDKIMYGQFPTDKERLKSALDDPEVVGGFEAADLNDPTEAEELTDFLGFIASKHMLFQDEIIILANRIEMRTRRRRD